MLDSQQLTGRSLVVLDQTKVLLQMTRKRLTRQEIPSKVISLATYDRAFRKGISLKNALKFAAFLNVPLHRLLIDKLPTSPFLSSTVANGTSLKSAIIEPEHDATDKVSVSNLSSERQIDPLRHPLDFRSRITDSNYVQSLFLRPEPFCQST
jgi:hypothetical protein